VHQAILNSDPTLDEPGSWRQPPYADSFSDARTEFSHRFDPGRQSVA